MKSDSNKRIRKIQTQQFGEIAVEPQYIFNFEAGLLGFEDLREFVLISDEDTEPFKWLISVENPEIGFPLLSPWHIDLTYSPGKKFEVEELVLFAIITLENNRGLMTANMKAPVVLNIKDQNGEQIILPKDKYLPDYVIPLKQTEAEAQD